MRREEERTGLSKYPGSRRKIVLNSRAHPNAIAGTVVSTTPAKWSGSADMGGPPGMSNANSPSLALELTSSSEGGEFSADLVSK